MLVQEFLEQSADRFPDKTALIAEEKRYTYKEIECLSNQFANSLIARGIKRGDRVVLFLPNCVETVISIFGVLKAGGVFVVVNPTTKTQKLAYIINNCQAAALVTSYPQNIPDSDDPLISTLQMIVSTVKSNQPLKNQIIEWREFLNSSLSSRPKKTNIDLDLACLIYTSGSTGDPKGVMSDHSNVDFATGSIIQYLKNTQDDIVIGLLPLSFDYGLYQLLMAFKFGGTLVLEKGFLFPAAILKKMEQEHVTGFPGVPTIFAVLLKMDFSPYDLSSLRYITNTAAALPVSHIQQIRQKFPGAQMYSMYGLTETKRTLFLPPEELDRRPGSVGIAIPGTEVWLEDENGNHIGPGQVGELVIRGRHVMRGYWNAPELTAKRYRPGPLPGERVCYSGDYFRQDEEGFLYFVSRMDDIIKCKGEKVSPVELERILYELPEVSEAAVIGVPDPVLGQAIKVFIVVSGSQLDGASVLHHLRARVEDYMIPKYIEFVNELPKTSSGKIKKTDLH